MEDIEDQVAIGMQALSRCLHDFREGNVTNRKSHTQRLRQHLRPLAGRWNRQFKKPPNIRVPSSSFLGVCLTGVRDRYLKMNIVQLLSTDKPDYKSKTVVNPACVFGRHARDLASRLSSYQIIGTDIDPRFNRFYTSLSLRGSPPNYQFRQDDIFSPVVKERPVAVVFFGACGSVSDGAIDYGIQSGAPLLAFRTCCHDNIGGNTTIIRKFSALNLIFRIKNWIYSRKRDQQTGEYFSEAYSQGKYPRSRVARKLSDSDEFRQISSNSVDSDTCRAIIDLDRYLYLAEQGYEVWLQGDLFIAKKTRQNT